MTHPKLTSRAALCLAAPTDPVEARRYLDNQLSRLRDLVVAPTTPDECARAAEAVTCLVDYLTTTRRIFERPA